MPLEKRGISDYLDGIPMRLSKNFKPIIISNNLTKIKLIKRLTISDYEYDFRTEKSALEDAINQTERILKEAETKLKEFELNPNLLRKENLVNKTVEDTINLSNPIQLSNNNLIPQHLPFNRSENISNYNHYVNYKSTFISPSNQNESLKYSQTQSSNLLSSSSIFTVSPNNQQLDFNKINNDARNYATLLSNFNLNHNSLNQNSFNQNSLNYALDISLKNNFEKNLEENTNAINSIKNISPKNNLHQNNFFIPSTINPYSNMILQPQPSKILAKNSSLNSDLKVNDICSTNNNNNNITSNKLPKNNSNNLNNLNLNRITINPADFENSSSPFDEALLKSIDEKEELNNVFQQAYNPR